METFKRIYKDGGLGLIDAVFGTFIECKETKSMKVKVKLSCNRLC
jgi:hypothetical protein